MPFIHKVIHLLIQQVFTESCYRPKRIHVQGLNLQVVHAVNNVTTDNYLMNNLLYQLL